MTPTQERSLRLEVKALRREVERLKAQTKPPGYMAQMNAGAPPGWLSYDNGKTWQPALSA